MMFAVPTRAVRGRSRLRRRAEPAADRPRRSRAELQHVDRADGRLVATPTCSRRSRPASAPCGARCTAGPTRPASQMLEQIRRDGGNVKKYVDMAKDKNNNFRLMGFGHRVYKNFDPRATIIKAACDKLLAKRQHQRPDLRHRQAARRGRAERPVLHRAEALPERRFLLGRDLPRDRHSGADVHGAVRHGPAAGLDRPLGGNAHAARPRRSAARGRFTPGRRSGRSCRWTSGRCRKVFA